MSEIVKMKICIVPLLLASLVAGCAIRLAEQPPALEIGKSASAISISPYVGCWEHGFIATEVSCSDMVVNENELIISKGTKVLESVSMIDFSTGPIPVSLKCDIYEIVNGKKSKHVMSATLNKFPQAINLSLVAGKTVYVDCFARWGNWGDAYYIFSAVVAP